MENNESYIFKMLGYALTVEDALKIIHDAYIPVAEVMSEYFDDLPFSDRFYRINGINLKPIFEVCSRFMDTCVNDDSDLFEIFSKKIKENDTQFINDVKFLLYYANYASILSTNMRLAIESMRENIKARKNVTEDEEVEAYFVRSINGSAVCREILYNLFNNGELVSAAVKLNSEIDVTKPLILKKDKFNKIIGKELLKKLILCGGFITVRDVYTETLNATFKIFNVIFGKSSRVNYAMRIVLRCRENGTYDKISIEVEDLSIFRIAFGDISADIFRVMIGTGYVMDLNTGEEFIDTLKEIAESTKDISITDFHTLIRNLTTMIIEDRVDMEFFNELSGEFNAKVYINTGGIMNYKPVLSVDKDNLSEALERPIKVDEFFKSKDELV